MDVPYPGQGERMWPPGLVGRSTGSVLPPFTFLSKPPGTSWGDYGFLVADLHRHNEV